MISLKKKHLFPSRSLLYLLVLVLLKLFSLK